MLDKQTAVKNLDTVITDIEEARLRVNGHHIVKLIAISKYSEAEEIRTLYEAGQRAFGENKVQDLRDKSALLDDLPLEWHFVGTLQKNKINNLIDLKPTLMHSLDSMDLAYELDKKLKAKDRTMNCLLQINSAYEETKSGVDPKEAKELFEKITKECTNIKLKGVMSIGAHSEDCDNIKESFNTTKEIFDSCENATICSMGMSSDFKLAIELGSNMIRVGSKLFK